MVEGVHVPIPEAPVVIAARASAGRAAGGTSSDGCQRPLQPGALTTDADRLVDQYRKIGEAEKHVYGQNGGDCAQLQHQSECAAGDADSAFSGRAGFGAAPPAGDEESLTNPHERSGNQFPRQISAKRRF